MISLRSLPTWITSCFYEDLCGCCAQIGNSCIASVKLCAERRNSSVKVFASERHEVPVNLLDSPWKWTGTWTCPHCWWCPLTCWDCSVPSYRLFIRQLNSSSPSIHPWGMPLVTDYQLDFVLLTTRPSQFSAHLISAHPELPFLFFFFFFFFLLRQMNSFYMNLSVQSCLGKELATPLILKGFCKILNMQIIIIIMAGNNGSSMGFLYFFRFLCPLQMPL